MTRGAPLPSAVGARAAGLLALLAPIGSIGCAAPAPTYVAPDASAWSLRPTRWVPADAGSAGYALVSNSLSNSISVLDLTAGTTLATIPVGVVPLTENGPHHIAFDPREGTLFTPLSFPPAAIPAGPHAAHGSSQRPGTLVKRAASDPGSRNLANVPELLLLGGGLPILQGVEVIGGIGVAGSGGSVTDEQCASAALAALAP